MVRTAALFSIAFMLAACGTAMQEHFAERDDQTCQSYGAKPGTDAYVQCRTAIASQRSAENTSARLSAAAALDAASQSYYRAAANPPPSTYKPPVQCQSQQQGNMVYTNCR